MWWVVLRAAWTAGDWVERSAVSTAGPTAAAKADKTVFQKADGTAEKTVYRWAVQWAASKEQRTVAESGRWTAAWMAAT